MATNAVTKAEMEEFVERFELRLKELSPVERIVRVEEELKNLREMFEIKFEAMDKRFEALQREMNARFEIIQKGFSFVQWMILICILVGIPAFIITLKELVNILK